MNKNFIVSTVVIIIYVILFGLFIKLHKEVNHFCTSNSPCIRFCSTNSEEFSDKSLLDEFMKSESAEKLASNLSVETSKILRGPPTCGGMSFTPPDYRGHSSIVHYNFDQV